MSYLSATKTAQNVIDYVKRQFGDESGVQISDADVIRWINAGQDEIFRRNEPIKSSGSADLVAGTHTYNFPANILKVQSLLVNGVPVKPVSYQEAEEHVIDEDPNRTQTGQPQIWYEWGGQFTLWPTPEASVVGGISIKFVQAPTQIVAANNALSIPDAYFMRLVEFVLAQAYELDENWAAAQSKNDQFENNLGRQNHEGATQFATYPRITVLDEDL